MADGAHGRRIRVLIVDDHALLREGLRKVLDFEDDIEVVGEAADGAEGIAVAKKLLPDVVLLDINMPGMSGLEAVWRLKGEVPSCEILVLTIHSDAEYVFEVIKAGAKGYILKDIEPAKMVHAIRTVARGDSYLPSDLLAHVLTEFKRLAGEAAVAREQAAPPAGAVMAPATMPGKSGQPMASAATSPSASAMPSAGQHPPVGAAVGIRTTEPATAIAPPGYDDLTRREKEILSCLAEGLHNDQIAERLFISEKTVKNHISSILRKLNVDDRTQAAILAVKFGVNGRA